MKVAIPVPGLTAKVVFDTDDVTGVSTSNEYRDSGVTPTGAVVRELTGRTTLTLTFDRPGTGPRYE